MIWSLIQKTSEKCRFLSDTGKRSEIQRTELKRKEKVFFRGGWSMRPLRGCRMKNEISVFYLISIHITNASHFSPHFSFVTRFDDDSGRLSWRWIITSNFSFFISFLYSNFNSHSHSHFVLSLTSLYFLGMMTSVVMMNRIWEFFQ